MQRWVGEPQEPFQRITVDEAKNMIDSGEAYVIDVREPAEYREGHVPNAMLIPIGMVLDRWQELPKDKALLFICAVGQRSAVACEMAAAMGLTRLYNIEGGTDSWIQRGYSVDFGLG